MEKYNYYSAVREDVKQYIKDNYTQEEINNLINTREESEDKLYEKMWIADSVTGNGTGSYWCNAWKAEETICHNLDLLGEAMQEFSWDFKDLQEGAEWADVVIRCYLLSQSISAVLDELEEESLDYETTKTLLERERAL